MDRLPPIKRFLPRRACKIILSLILAVIGSASLADLPGTAEKDVLRATLANGLRVIVVHNGLAPVVATSVNYLVGSDEAPAGFPGMAHAQEHMMFRGSTGLTADQLANIGSIMGGSFNANTRESLTQYLYTVPADDLDVALHIEAVRMADVLDAKADWDKERGAIEQEVASDRSNPEYVLYEQVRAAMFAGTPYEHDALGTRPSFDKTTAAMLQSFHDKWYAPNNAILIVVGDVDPAATLSEIKTLFGGIKSRPLPARPVLALKPVKADSIQADTDSPVSTLMITMRVPGLNSPDFPALEVLSDVLSSHKFDLYGLVPQGKAIDASFELDPLPQAGLALTTVAFPAEGDPKVVARDTRAILAKVARDGVPAELVAAAKLQERRAAEFEKNSIEGLASVWADAVALYGLKSPDDDLVRINKVTVADVNRVARKYLDLDHAISAVATPKGSGKPTSGGGFGGQENIALGEAKPTALPDWAQAAIANLSVPKSTTNPVVSTLPNGITLIVQPESVSDTVTIFGHIKTRAETEEPKGKQGVASVLSELFAYGSEHLDRLHFQQALDRIGASESAGTDFAIEALAPNFDRAASLLADNELHPALPPQAMTVIRDQLTQVVAASNKSPAYLTRRSLREALFPRNDPSLNDAVPDSVSSLTPADVRAYYAYAYRPDLTTIVVIGKTTPEQAKAIIEKYFGGWNASGPKPITDLPPVPSNAPAIVAVPDASRVQDDVTVAETMGLTRKSPDYYALELGNAVLGGGFYSTRLSIDLRKNAGLVYSVNSDLQAGETRSLYFVRYSCDPENVSRASDLVARELTAMQTAPPSVDELMRVKALLIRQIPLSEASIGDIARGFAARHDLGLPLDEPRRAAQRYIDLTGADVQAAFKKWLRPGDIVRVSQGPAPQ